MSKKKDYTTLLSSTNMPTLASIESVTESKVIPINAVGSDVKTATKDIQSIIDSASFSTSNVASVNTSNSNVISSNTNNEVLGDRFAATVVFTRRKAPREIKDRRVGFLTYPSLHDKFKEAAAKNGCKVIDAFEEAMRIYIELTEKGSAGVEEKI